MFDPWKAVRMKKHRALSEESRDNISVCDFGQIKFSEYQFPQSLRVVIYFPVLLWGFNYYKQMETYQSILEVGTQQRMFNKILADNIGKDAVKPVHVHGWKYKLIHPS